MDKSSQRIIAWGIFIFCCGAIYPMIKMPMDMRGGIYKRMNQESQTHVLMITSFEHNLNDRIDKEAGQTKDIDERLSLVEKSHRKQNLNAGIDSNKNR